MLLNIFLNGSGVKSGLNDDLSKIISERKKEFMNGSVPVIQPESDKPVLTKINIIKIAAIILSIVIITTAAILFNRKKPEVPSVVKIERNTPAKVIDSLADEHGIVIEDTDIYEYANIIAVKNGFMKIIRGIIQKDKNPDWIYPGNVFLLHDDEKITVKKGDTLWSISRRKLIESEINFNKKLKEMKSRNSSGTEDIAELKKFAISSKSRESFSNYISSVKKENGKQQ
jgi:hypothetical protein